MAKISALRKKFLQMMLGEAPADGWLYFRSLTNYTLEKYGLTMYDNNQITWAEKAGHIETNHYQSFGRITQAGREALERS